MLFLLYSLRGGGGEIRTRVGLAPPAVFETVPLNHLGTPPVYTELVEVHARQDSNLRPSFLGSRFRNDRTSPLCDASNVLIPNLYLNLAGISSLRTKPGPAICSSETTSLSRSNLSASSRDTN